MAKKGITRDIKELVLVVMAILICGWVLLGPGLEFFYKLLEQFGLIAPKSPELEEAIKCAYYRCTKGCDYVKQMKWEFLMFDTRTYGPTQKLYCCEKGGTFKWSVKEKCDDNTWDRFEPAKCKDCSAECESRDKKWTGIITGGDKNNVNAYCACEYIDPDKRCPCSTSPDWDIPDPTTGLGDGKICKDESKNHPIIQNIEQSTIKLFDKFNIMFTPSDCVVGYPIGPSINVKNSFVVEDTCKKDVRYRYLTSFSQCTLKGGKYYVYAAGESSLGDWAVHVILCDRATPACGDGVCESTETLTNCPQDCSAQAQCIAVCSVAKDMGSLDMNSFIFLYSCSFNLPLQAYDHIKFKVLKDGKVTASLGTEGEDKSGVYVGDSLRMEVFEGMCTTPMCMVDRVDPGESKSCDFNGKAGNIYYIKITDLGNLGSITPVNKHGPGIITASLT